MRCRSETINAKNEEDFIKQLRENDKQINSRNKRKSNFSSNFGKIEKDDFLSSDFDFQLSTKELTSYELEKEEEQHLLESFSHLNMHLKKRDQTEFLKSLLNLIENDSSFNSNMSDYSGKRRFNRSPLNNYNTENILDLNHVLSKAYFSPVISENLSIFDEKLKLLVIGENSVGKSLFISNFLKIMNGEKTSSIKNSLDHTESLEISKRLINLKDQYVSLELWDTNTEIIDSSIFKTYLKICDGFIMICSSENMESIKFLERQIENVINHSNYSSNILVLVNTNKKKTDLKKKVNEYTSYLIDKYNVDIIFKDLNDECIYLNKFQKFLNYALLNKLKHSKDCLYNSRDTRSKFWNWNIR